MCPRDCADRKLWRTLWTVLTQKKYFKCRGIAAHIVQQNELIKNGTIHGTEIPLATLGIGNGLSLFPSTLLTKGWMRSYRCLASLHSPLTIPMTCLTPLMSVDRRVVFNDSVASYGLQSAFSVGGAQEQLLNCHNPAPDANATELCAGTT